MMLSGADSFFDQRIDGKTQRSYLRIIQLSEFTDALKR